MVGEDGRNLGNWCSYSQGEQIIGSGGVWDGNDVAVISQMLQDQGRPPEVLGFVLGCK